MRGVLQNQLSKIPLYQETDEEPVWSVLGGGKDDVFVYDRCGRLAYYIPYPMSLLSKPYVEAAILTTYFNDPCGMCNETLFNTQDHHSNHSGHYHHHGNHSSGNNHHHHSNHYSHHHHHHSNHSSHHHHANHSTDHQRTHHHQKREQDPLEAVEEQVLVTEEPNPVENDHNGECPELNREFCRDWRPKFRLMKHCCLSNREHKPRRCSVFTPTKCQKTLHLKKCCQLLHRHGHTTEEPTTEKPTSEPCSDVNDDMCELLARLGFTYSSCCPQLSRNAVVWRENSEKEMCERFDDRLCSSLHSNHLEHRCCTDLRWHVERAG